MKVIHVLTLLLFVSCKYSFNKKDNKSKITKTKYFLGKRTCCWDPYLLFEYNNNHDSLKGKITYFNYNDKSPVAFSGFINDSIITISYKNRKETKTVVGKISKADKIKLKLNHQNLDLIEIDSNTYRSQYLEIHPKLKNIENDTVIDNFIFNIKITNWDPRTHIGKTTITIKDKITNQKIQEISSNEIVNNENGLYFFLSNDYNFDNNKDLYFSTGNLGPYGSQSGSYYIYNVNEKKFERNLEFEKIANSLAFKIDTITKKMTSFNRGSCCIHYTNTYKWKKNYQIELIKSMFIDRQYKNIIILKKRKNNKLITVIKKPYSEKNEILANKIYKKL